MTDLAAEFARAAVNAREGGQYRGEGCGWAETAANAVLAPWLDQIQASHARYRERLDAALQPRNDKAA